MPREGVGRECPQFADVGLERLDERLLLRACALNNSVRLT